MTQLTSNTCRRSTGQDPHHLNYGAIDAPMIDAVITSTLYNYTYSYPLK